MMRRIIDQYVGKKIRITFCWCMAPVYYNCTVGSVHTIVTPPGITKNSEKGVWIRGVGEDIYLQREEYEFVKITRAQ